jgi:hypothetical protein
MTQEKLKNTDKLASFMFNEVFPRAKKAGKKPEDFLPPKVLAFLWELETSGTMTRGQVRTFLDKQVKVC